MFAVLSTFMAGSAPRPGGMGQRLIVFRITHAANVL
jgi:hypothetical protein